MSDWTIYYLNYYVPMIVFLAIFFVGMRRNSSQYQKTRDHQANLIAQQERILVAVNGIKATLDDRRSQ